MDPKAPPSHFALVLPGAVARGAYEAGVIEVLAESDMRIDRIVATSSGALNGLAYAAGIRAGREREMAAKLSQSWVENGSWQTSLNLSPWTILGARGLSNRDGLLKMMRGLVHPCAKSKKREVELQVVVTPLNGVIGRIGHRPATTYEKLLKFSGPDFDTQDGLERIFNAVTAACAFPGLYAPVDLEGLGFCVDGGAVNNTPIGAALAESGVNRVMVPVPFPAEMPPGDWKRGMNLVSHFVEILINERLYRDLKAAQTANRQIEHLEHMVKTGKVTQEQLELILKFFALRKVDITEIRPREGLKGGSFSGFFRKSEREQLVESGRIAARDRIASLPKAEPHT